MDEISYLITQAIGLIEDGQPKAAQNRLYEAKGYIEASTPIELTWEVIKDRYESGEKPKDIARSYTHTNITARAITNKAFRERWVSPSKINRHLKKKAKQVFIKHCRLCNMEFEAYSGHACVCQTCKAKDTKKNAIEVLSKKRPRRKRGQKR